MLAGDHEIVTASICTHVDLPMKPLLLDSQFESFILFIGPISSLFNYATFLVMVQVFDWWYSPSLFHTGWFVELLFTQTLTHHVICTNQIPFIESWAS